jgi:hypothetical protein
MSNKRIKRFVVLFVIVMAAGSCVLLYLKRAREERLAAQQQETAKLAEKKELQRRIAKLASKTNAITKWREEFSNNGEFLFTADVTRVFVRPDGRPLLFDRAKAQDVAQHGEEFLCYFGVDISPSDLWYLQGSTTARLALSCDPSMAREMMQRGEGEIYAVVARISAVPSYDEVNPNDASDESFGKSSTERRFVVSGIELGQEPVATYRESFSLLMPQASKSAKTTPLGPND